MDVTKIMFFVAGILVMAILVSAMIIVFREGQSSNRQVYSDLGDSYASFTTFGLDQYVNTSISGSKMNYIIDKFSEYEVVKDEDGREKKVPKVIFRISTADGSIDNNNPQFSMKPYNDPSSEWYVDSSSKVSVREIKDESNSYTIGLEFIKR